MKKIILIFLIILLTSCSAVKPTKTPIVQDTIPCEITVMNQSKVLVLQQKKIKREETKSTILYVLLSLLAAITGFEIIKQ